MKIAARSAAAPASPIRRLVPYAEQAAARGLKVYFLNIGQPDIETPPEMMSVLKDLDLKVLAYSPSQGYAEYRKALAVYYARAGIEVSPDEILVTTAGSEAITFAMATLMDPGDEVLIPEPLYANYLGFAALLGVKVVPITCRVEEGYHLPSRAAIDALITPRTRAILFCNPGNPTGVVYTAAELDMLVQLSLDHQLYVISDEVYREFTYDGNVARSILSYPEIADRAVLVDSISKRYSACGARIGCFVTRNTEIMAGALRYAQARLSPPTIGQYVGLAASKLKPDYSARMVAEYKSRRDLVFDAVSRWPGVVCLKPGGAFYQMARLPVDDAERFVIWLLESFSVDGATTLLAPGEGFYATPDAGRQEVRIAYVLNRTDLGRAMDIVERGLAEYPGRRPA
jgi:aspartate aminotransferase